MGFRKLSSPEPRNDILILSLLIQTFICLLCSLRKDGRQRHRSRPTSASNLGLPWELCSIVAHRCDGGSGSTSRTSYQPIFMSSEHAITHLSQFLYCEKCHLWRFIVRNNCHWSWLMTAQNRTTRNDTDDDDGFVVGGNCNCTFVHMCRWCIYFANSISSRLTANSQNRFSATIFNWRCSLIGQPVARTSFYAIIKSTENNFLHDAAENGVVCVCLSFHLAQWQPPPVYRAAVRVCVCAAAWTQRTKW